MESLDEKLEEIKETRTQIENATGKTVIGTLLGMIGVGLIAKSYNVDPNAINLGLGLYAGGVASILTAAYFFATGIHTINDKVKELYDLAISPIQKDMEEK